MTNKKILIVDDEEIIREMYKHLFTTNGWRIHLADCAVKALKIMESENCPVIITDIFLGDMDGEDLLQTLKINFPETIVIGVSGSLSQEQSMNSYGSGFFHSFPKPVSLSRLLDAAQSAYEHFLIANSAPIHSDAL